MAVAEVMASLLEVDGRGPTAAPAGDWQTRERQLGSKATMGMFSKRRASIAGPDA